RVGPQRAGHFAFTVSVNGDRLAEANQTLTVNLSAPTNATIADGTGVGTIVDDEPRISIGDKTVTEGNTGSTTSATFTVTLSATYDATVTVNSAPANGTATAGSDYQAASGTDLRYDTERRLIALKAGVTPTSAVRKTSPRP